MPRIYLTRYILLLCFFVMPAWSYATHYLAGQITYKKTGANTFLITLTTYADRSSGVFAANCFVSMEMGDGTVISQIPRKNGPSGNCGAGAKEGEPILRNVQKSIYETEYTYAGPGIFQIRFYDDNRFANIINMTNSVNTSFYVYSTIRNIPGISSDAPELLNDPIDIACIGEIFTHSPGGYDPDGDSLAYSLIPSMQYRPGGSPNVPFPIPVTNFQFPDNVSGNTPGTFSQNNQTGMITWNTPLIAGYYNIAFLVVSYRRGVPVDSVVRDMVIIVDPTCNNRPPIIESITDTCVSVGDTLRFRVKVWDPDPLDSIYLYLNNGGGGNNGPFAATLPTPQATIRFFPPAVIPVVRKSDTIFGEVEWIVNCNHTRRYFYQVDFFAHDNIMRPPNEKFLTAYHSVMIRVRPPALQNLVASPARKSIELKWNKSICSDVHTYRIYRREGEAAFTPDTVCCGDAPENFGFTMIGTSVINNPPAGIIAWTDTSFVDTTVEYGKTYCYVVVGNINESPISQGVVTCPTNQVCVYIADEAPRITNVSVEATDATAGEIWVRWTQPKNIDSSGVIAPRPLHYAIYRADGISGTNFTLIGSRIPYADTTFTDTAMDTENRGYTYQVGVMDDDAEEINISAPASSLYLRLQPADQSMGVTWTPVDVPWVNQKYYLYRADALNGAYVLLDSTDGLTLNYVDTGLINYQDYCYYISSLGGYGGDQPIDSLVNLSQRVCDAPRDLTPPCLPDDSSLQMQSSCDALKVYMSWALPADSCASDLDYFRISRGPTPEGPFQLLHITPDIATAYEYQDALSIAGCYAIQAVDTSGNISAYSRSFCFDNCPAVQLGNVFSPNGDGINDYFTPINMRAVRLESFTVYDRWGNLLFTQDQDPVRLWDGSTRNGPAAEGVYFYVLKGEYILLEAPEYIEMAGSLTLMR